jgi:hypothetical protein
MIQKAGRIGGEAQGACSLGAPLPQGVLAGGFVGTVGGAATGATVASQPAEHEEREPRAGCKRLPVVVSVVWAQSSSKRPVAVITSPSQATPRSREAPREAQGQ